MELRFSKWHGTGNDFILIDDRDGSFPVSDEIVRRLCDRHFGVGSDGLILIQAPRQDGTRFHMEFFNPDASRSFCGNGSRCAFAFWSGLNDAASSAAFTAIDGVHQGEWRKELVAITLRDVAEIIRGSDGSEVDFVQNGSPHELVWVDDPGSVAIMKDGPRRRNAPAHAPGGTNVNFLRARNGVVEMRTYERGVEAETMSCGTGVVAAALSALVRGQAQAPVAVRTPGGTLSVEALLNGDGASQLCLIGPVAEVFTGTITI
ncbi:MAG: diaminopimelate epimerase [Flavobacteriales bacterium]|nr:diaminopimelate epimerase [Flavobacteriales bacterium]